MKKIITLSLFILFWWGMSQEGWGQYSGTGTFKKITSIDDLTDGYYVLVNSGDAFAMNNTNGGSFFGNTSVSPSSGSLTNPAAAIVWKIETNGGGRTIYNEASSKYVSYTGSSNAAYAVDAVSADAQRWSFSYASNVFSIANLATSARILQYNASSPRFACYTTSQQKILLYKLEVINEPTTQASSITFDPVGVTSMTVNWTNGNGAGRAVFMKEGSGAITNPSDGTSYTASADWGSKGTQLGSSGYYCIYNGTGTSVELTNLSQNTQYTVQVFEYNGSGTNTNYFTSTATGNPNSQTTNAASEPLLTISADPALTELNLNGAEISLELTNDEFKDDVLVNGNFTLNNAPAGVTINSVTWNTATTATLTLDYDGTDFDSDITNFSITIAITELINSEDPLTSNTLTITAIVETAPTVTTDAEITTNGTTTATWGGNVSADGGEPVTQKGLVWNTSSEPTTSNSKTEEGAGTGAITGNMTGLTPNTTYYVRAYATNSVGTAYGAERSFTTNNLSAPTANPATQISSTGFTANWSSVSGAESYRLDVSQYETFTSVTNATDLFISEYVEGSSNNKYIEIYNGTGVSVDLSDYKLQLYANGTATTTSDVQLSGTLADGQSIVYKNSSAALVLPDGVNAITNAAVNFNGDDAIALFKISTSSFVDIFGRIGDDPGTAWTGDGGYTTLDKTLRRKSSVTGGVTTNPSGIGATAFTTLTTEWDLYNIDVSSDLGSHTYGSPSYVTDYNNRTVNSLSETLTGLTAGTNYYYRVRAYSTVSTSSNSSTITVKTANNSQNTAVGGTGAQNIPVAGTTGIGNVNFTNVTTPGDLLISIYNNAPTSPTGVTGNVSNFRWLIEPDDNLVINEAAGYRLKFKVADLSGISELAHGNNNTIKLYKRTTPGSGEFTDLGYMTYDRSGTDGDQSDDWLESALITSGFSEFVFGSESEPLPVEFATLTATTSQGSVKISWQTATEINNYGFEVERTPHNPPFGKGGTQGGWEKIGFVAGHGNSNSTKDYSFTDNNIPTSGKYAYRLKQIDTDGSFSYSQVVETDVTVNLIYSLGQNYPNPFNPTTRISYTIPETGLVTLKVYSIVGETVAELVNQTQEAGKYEVEFSGSSLANGVYFYELKVNSFTSVKKLMLLK